MPSLTTPLSRLQAHYGVVVVGSGYGASVAACRMAELAQSIARPDTSCGEPGKTFSVCVLERGHEIATGDYPSTLTQLARQAQVDHPSLRFGSPTALFDFRLNPDISALLGCGLGGGSLINAGVMLRPPEDIFDDERWPRILRNPENGRNDTLDRYYNRARGEIDVSAVPSEVNLVKVAQLFHAAKQAAELDLQVRPPIAVSFRTRVNGHGVQRKACVLCGDCMTGCNHAAKNTLITNYLPAAANAGAAIFCEMDVRAIERVENRWHVHVRVLNTGFRTFGAPELTIQADAVFLGAGTLGSVEILMRSQRRGLSISPRLGERFSGNGDVIAFAYNAPEPVNGIGYGQYVPSDASVGPLIAGMIDERTEPDHVLIQEGTVPGALGPLIRFAAPLMARVSRRPLDLGADIRFRFFRRELDTMLRGVRHGALLRTQTLLGMGRDSSSGTMTLKRDRLRILWPRRHDANDPAISAITERMKVLTRGMKARYLVNPFWSRVFGRRRVTVHALGGACMADSAEQGVVNVNGEVFKGPSGSAAHDGLYVCDGAVVPVALGTNPALTIASLSERIADVATARVRALTKKAYYDDPGRVRPSVPGIRYGERLKGRISLDGMVSRFTMVLNISAEDVRALTDKPEHLARVVGVLRAHDLEPHQRQFTITDGSFEVMIDDPREVDSKLIIYRFTLTDAKGCAYVLTGRKTINHRTLKRGLWRIVASYPFVVVRDGHLAGKGVARSSVLDAIRMVASMRITHERGWIDRQIFTAAFRSFFTRSLINVLVQPLASGVRLNPLDPTRELPQYGIRLHRTLFDKKRPGRPRFKLTSYVRKGPFPHRGPVILAPGFGMSAYAFVLKDSLTEYLCKLGYEVWLLDYRASDRLAASLEQFTLDDLAIGDGTLDEHGIRGGTLAGDFPDAVDRVYHASGCKKVQIVAHCVASLTTFMSLLAGTLNEDRVQSVVLSQSFACIDHPWLNKLKAWIQLPQILKYMRFVTVMTPDYDLRSGWRSRMLDRVLRLYPTKERCSSGVCRRLLLMYGEVVRHDQLTKETHDMLHQLFDRANMTTFVHLSRMIAKGQIVDRNGKNVYLTSKRTGHINVPIALVQGKGNRLFRPRGGLRTHDWLLKHGGHGDRNKEMFRLRIIPGHGHLDTFIGKRGQMTVYRTIADLLAAPRGVDIAAVVET